MRRASIPWLAECAEISSFLLTHRIQIPFRNLRVYSKSTRYGALYDTEVLTKYCILLENLRCSVFLTWFLLYNNLPPCCLLSLTVSAGSLRTGLGSEWPGTVRTLGIRFFRDQDWSGQLCPNPGLRSLTQCYTVKKGSRFPVPRRDVTY